MKSVNERADGYVLKPFEVAKLSEMIRRLLMDKTDEYLSLLAESERARESTPTVRYQTPDRW
jgi:DNA-binding response OmpR family regulator